MKATQCHAKGSIITSFHVIHVVPLHRSDELPSLPEFDQHDCLPQKTTLEEGLLLNFLQKKQAFGDPSNYKTQCAQYSACRMQKKTTDSDREPDDDTFRETVQSISAIQKVADHLQQYRGIERQDFINCACETLGNMHIVSTPHSMSNYVTRVLPRLPRAQQARAIQLLGCQTHSIVAVVKQVQDRYPPIPCALTLRGDNLPTHSCLPNATFELDTTEPTSINLVALNDIAEDDMIQLSYIPDMESVEDRDELVQLRLGSSCLCPRCAYEWDPKNVIHTLQVDNLRRLAAYYMAHARWSDARRLCNHILQAEPAHADVRHAVGALELGEGRFLQAQRYWKRAAGEYPACARHEGIRLQLEKGRAYGYFDQNTRSNEKSTRLLSFRSVVSNVFVAKVLSEKKCHDILALTEQASDAWTTGRHYAVPTNDMPIHAQPTLLEWFIPFFQLTLRPLLARQFHSTPNFWVHDAFLVRYEADHAHNLLPIHTDESTHSFVLALNSHYEGGGTHFYESGQTVRLEVGELLSFRGDSIEHGGEAVTSGTRYIIAGFLYHDDDQAVTIARKRAREDREGHSGMMRQAKTASMEAFSFRFAFK